MSTDTRRVPSAGAHGDDTAGAAVALGLDPHGVLDLAMSLNPFAPDPVPVVARHLGALRRYPSASSLDRATRALADLLAVDPDRVLLTNGGAEAIALVAAELGGGWVEDPEFSLYRRHLARVDLSLPRFRSNPRNPTGMLAGAEETAGVWDEAFYPLATGQWTRGDADHGSWVVGSLTKLLACPGLRLGYVLAPGADERRAVADRQPRWSVSGPALDALPELLAAVDLPAWAAAVAGARRALEAVLGAHGFAAARSDAPYLLVEAPGLRERLAPHGVFVRDCDSFGLPGCVRIAVPDDAGLDRLDAALAAASLRRPR